MIPQDLTYDFPQAAFALFAIFVFLWMFWVLFNYRRETLQSFAEPSLLAKILVPRSSKVYWSKAIAIGLAWLFGILALMQPKGNGRYPEESLQNKKNEEVLAKVRRRAHDVIFLIDASASMSVKDSRDGTSRLDFAKEIADQIASRLKGETAALYAFTSQVAQLSPATTDYLFLRLMMRQIHINEGDVPGTDITHALQEMREKYFNGASPKLKTLILLSDGGDTAIEALQGEAREQAIDHLLEEIGHSEAVNLRIYTIGMGSLKGENIPHLSYEGKPVHSAIDEEILRKIARRGRGVYYPARDYTSIALAHDLIASMNQDHPFLEKETLIKTLANVQGGNLAYDLYYQIPLGLAVLLLAYLFFWPDVKKNLPIVLVAFVPLQEADLYFQAKDYAHAQDIYEGLLDGIPTPWQRAVILYNLGSTYLAKGQYEKAIDTFNSINLGEDPHPLLDVRVKTNLSLALLREADQLKTDQIDQLEKSLYLFREALDSINAALQADCTLKKAEGSLSCPASKELTDLKIYAKVDFAARLKRLHELRIKEVGPADGIPLLMTSLNQMLREISLLEKQSKYGALIFNEAKLWHHLWDSIWEKMDKSHQEAFLEAKKHFDAGILFMEEKSYPSARKEWEQAYAALNALMASIFKGDPMQEILRKLLAFYNYAAEQTPLQESTLAALQVEQEEALALLSDPIRQKLEEAQQGLVKGFAAVQKSENLVGMFYVARGRHIIQTLLRQMNPAMRPIDILKRAIEDQQYVLHLRRLMLGFDNPELSKLTQEAQEETVATASPFFTAVTDLQKQQFQRETGPRCQVHPWDEVLPLFDEGLQAAIQAKSSISEKEQEAALTHWQQALEKLQQPVQPSSGCQGEAKTEQQKNQKPAKEEKTPMQEVLRQLIEMEQDDRLPQQVPAIQMEGNRPW